MIGLTLKQAKAGFFDRAAVLSATSIAERKVLSRFGAFVRQRAKTSIRPRKDSSAPGSPPSSHVGLLRQHLYFAWDRDRRSVVIGPVRLNKGQGDAPMLLEYGGTATRSRWGRSYLAHYRARPFMRPAFDAELPRLPPQWRNSIR
jgi:hypothetical protein